MKVIIVGNQNSGKSALFNALTGSVAPVGNRAGVTVEAKERPIKRSHHTLIDLPGTYSLIAFTEEEKITCDYVKEKDYDVILNVLDCTATERSLSLTLELKSVNKPVIVILNMCDRLKTSGIDIDEKRLETLIGCPVVLASVKKNIGLKTIIDAIDNVKGPPTGQKSFLTASERFSEVEKICFSVVKGRKSPSIGRSIDKIVLNRFLAVPVFAAVMFVCYSLSVGFVGKYLSDLLSGGIAALSDLIKTALLSAKVSKTVISLLVDGVFKGLGSVASFIPQVAILFLLLSLLESTGYMTRAAFVFERLFSAIGLNGKSLVPFIVGTGCSVPAVSSARVIESKRQKTLTVMLTPFMPCSAKLPIIALFGGFFFPDTSGLFAFSTYVTAIILIIITALSVKFFIPDKKDIPFIFEMTDYKTPDVKATLKEVGYKLLSFIKRVGTTVFVCTVIMWSLTAFTPTFSIAATAEDSILSMLGRLLSPLLTPVLGVNSWQATVCAIQGLIAKEQVVSGMNVIAGVENAASVFDSNAFGFFDRASAYAYVCFNLFSPPCVSAIAAMHKEIGLKMTAVAALYQLAVAFIFSTLIRLLLSLL